MSTNPQASPSNDVVSRRFNPERLRFLAELRFLKPEATWQELAAEVGVNVRTSERWRRSPEWEVAFREAAVRHVSALVPYAIAALRKAWALGRGESQAIAIMQSSGLLAGKQVDVHHSGRVDVDFTAMRQRVIDRIDELAASPPSAAPDAGPSVEPLRFPVIDAKVVDANGAGSDS